MTEPAFLLDSNICIYLLEGMSDRARARVETYQPGAIVTSAVAFAEVMVGIDRSDPVSIVKVSALFRLIDVLPFDAEAARSYAQLSFRRGSFDRMIAGHALALGLPLVTANERDFADIPGLKVENWTLG